MNRDITTTVSVIIGIIIIVLIAIGAWKNLSATKDIENNIVDKIEDEDYANLYEPSIPHTDTKEEKKTFIGTVLEETTTYMIVMPHKDSIERKSADKIQINYGTNHLDYLYGLGRKVIIEYAGTIKETYPAQINTDKIYINGYEDFNLIVKTFDKDSTSEYSGDRKILNNNSLYKNNSDYDLYYSGVEEVYVKVAGKELTLKDALIDGYVTLDGIVEKANKDFPDAISYDDGGTIDYEYSNYIIKRYHTLDGNRDLWIIAK